MYLYISNRTLCILTYSDVAIRLISDVNTNFDLGSFITTILRIEKCENRTCLKSENLAEQILLYGKMIEIQIKKSYWYYRMLLPL